MLYPPNNDFVDSIAIYNPYTQNNILRIEPYPNYQSWKLSSSFNEHLPTDSSLIFAVDKLRSVENGELVVFADAHAVLNQVLLSELYTLLLVLGCSALLYIFLKPVINRHYSLLGSMKHALKNKEFFPVYQPLFDITQQRYMGAELLLRWYNEDDELVMPDFFIEEAEASGLIVPITLHIVAIAFKEARLILSNYPDFYLSINISYPHLIDPQFFPQFYLLMQEFELTPKQILFEITERAILNKDDESCMQRLNELKEKGFALAVDDYGTGYASISYLQNFPFDHLKIDKIFIQAIGTKAITESLNDAIIQMAKDLNLIIIAEGVETEEQFNYLSANGVRFLQGWYFSKAVAIEQLIDLLERGYHEHKK